MTDDYEQMQAQRDEHLSAYEQYAAEEARGYEQIFWEQVFVQAYSSLTTSQHVLASWEQTAQVAAKAADYACAERAKRLK